MITQACALKAKADVHSNLLPNDAASKDFVMEESPSAEGLDSDLVAEAMQTDDGAPLAKRRKLDTYSIMANPDEGCEFPSDRFLVASVLSPNGYPSIVTPLQTEVVD